MQRKLLAAACMLLILGQIYCEIPRGTACPNSNPFIKLMRKAKIGLYEKPMISTSDVCDFEFEKYGSCCNPTQLKDYAHQDSSEILEIAKKLGTEYKNFQGIIPRIFKRIKQIALAPLHQKDQALNN